MKHKVENLVDGKWVQAFETVEKVTTEVKKEKHISDVKTKKLAKIVNISEKDAKTLNIDSALNGVRYVKVVEKKEEGKKKE